MRVSLRRFVVLYILSFGLYMFYWYYCSLKELKEQQGLDISPGWRTAAFCIPVVNLFLLYGLFKRIDQAAESADSEPRHSAGWMMAAFLLIPMAINCLTGQWMTHESFMAAPALVWADLPLRLLMYIPMIWVLSRIIATANGYWDKMRPTALTATTVSVGEKAIVIAGFVMTFGSYALTQWFYTSYSALMNGFTTMY